MQNIDKCIYEGVCVNTFLVEDRCVKMESELTFVSSGKKHTTYSHDVSTYFSLCWLYTESVEPQARTAGNLKLQFTIEIKIVGQKNAIYASIQAPVYLKQNKNE